MRELRSFEEVTFPVYVVEHVGVVSGISDFPQDIEITPTYTKV